MMNKDTKIRVSTSVGETEEKETRENIGQVTLYGANISAANIDFTVNMFFKDSIDELSYGEPRLQPLLFQDDINRVATSVLTAQKGNNQNESVVETMLLDFNLDKSCYIVMGNEKAKKSLNMELEENPLMLCGQIIKNVHMEKYLGNMICSGGSSLSVQATVMKRKGQTMSSII